MADLKISQLTAITTLTPATDVLPVVDVTGTTKKITTNQILGSGGTATLASATITGALTAQGTQVKLANQAAADCTVLIGPDSPSATRSGRIGFVTSSTEKNWFIANNWNVPGGFEITQSTAAGGSTISSNPTFRINNNSDFLFLDGAGGTRMTLNSTGLGVGVTPSAWGNYKVLEVGTTSSLYNDGGVATDLSNNMYINSSFAYIRKIAAAATRYEQNAGAHAWYNAASSTAGSAITFTQAMTLDASGNLLVGTTSNANTARAYFRYDTLTIQPVINSASIVAASTSWNHFIGQSGNGSTVTTNNIFIRGNGDIINANGIYGTISDLRLKENIADARNYLSDLLKLRVVKYSLKEEDSAVANKLGFIAQEVEQVFPKMVDTDSEDTKSIKISLLIPMLVKAIQELTARVQTLEAR
jgi:hypothetical protein